MRLFLLTILTMVVGYGFAQNPKVALNKTNITASTTIDGTVTQTFTITNTGNRDLNWSLKEKGTPVKFTKAPYADWTLGSNQDRISSNVWITRKNTQGLFNIAQESGFTSSSPINTEWSFGKTEDLSPENYTNWQNAVGGDPQSMIGQIISLHTIAEDRYFDIAFDAFSGNNTGGGFGYTRTEIGLNWLSADVTSGTLIPGQSKTVTITYDANELVSAAYSGNIIVVSNDPFTPEASIATTFNVGEGQGTPDINTVASKNIGIGYVNYEFTGMISVNNLGTGVLNVTNVASSNTSFIPAITSFSVAPGKSYDLPVRFLSATAGHFTSTLTLTSNDPDESPLAISIAADAVGAPVAGVNQPSFTATVASGDVTSQELTITNNGLSDLTYAISFELGSSAPVTFEKKDFADPTLPENQDWISNGIRLTRADERGLFNAVVEGGFNSSVSPANTAWARVSTAQAIEEEYEYSVWRSALGGDIPSYVNATTSMLLTAENRYFDLTLNQWTCCENGGGFKYTRTEIYNWATASTTTGTLASGASQSMDLQFNGNGRAAGQYTGFLVITSNDPAAPVKRIPLTLNVTSTSDASLFEESISAGNVAIGNTGKQKFRVLNNGGAPLQVTSITTFDAAVTVMPSTMTIAPFSYGVFEATFKPTAQQDYSGTIQVTTNDPEQTGPLSLTFSGAGVAPGSIQAVADLNATVETGSTVTKTITIQNTGTGDLNWTIEVKNENPTITFSKADYADAKLAENQDRISSKVWITRDDNRGLFNAAVESKYTNDVSPLGTAWQGGPTVLAYPGWYTDWRDAIDGNPPATVNHVYSMHADHEYYDMIVRSWTSDDNGGGFSYERKKAIGWLKFYDGTGGTTTAGGESVIEVTFDPTDYLTGTHNEVIVIKSDDPTRPAIELPVSLIIQGMPSIESSADQIAFGNVGFGFNQTKTVRLTNTGTEVLNITGVASSNAAFTLSAASATLAPDQTLELQVTFTPGAVQSYTGNILITSNATNESGLTIALTGTGIQVPDVAVTPAQIIDLHPTSPVKAGAITIQNTGAETLQWNVGSPTIAPLQSLLDNLNDDYTSITNLIPEMFTFNYDGGNNYIGDGGYDMYDGGNYLNTNLQSGISYSDNAIADGTGLFGNNTHYFTRHLPGLFVMVADVNGLSSFGLTGNNGADGGGSWDATELSITKNGTNYTGFLKRVYNAGDPSINQLIIIESDNTVSQTYATNTDNTSHTINNIGNVKRIFYLLYAGINGGYIDNTAAKAIMTQFLNTVSGGGGFLPAWITLDQYTGTVSASASSTVNYTIDLTSYPEADYQAEIAMYTNDPDESRVVIPVRMNLGAVVVINEIADVVVNEGFGTKSIDISNVFTDGNNDILSYAVGSDINIVTGAVTGTTLTLTEHGTGTSIVSVRADDGHDHVVFEDFNFRVNDVPNVAAPIADQNMARFAAPVVIDIADVFADSDEADNLTYSVSNSNDAIASVVLANSKITITEHALGTTTITLTVNDGSGGTASEVFTVTVAKAAATVALSEISSVYTGSAKAVVATTTPAGLTVNIAYAQNGTVIASPVNAGSYDVTAMINDANYQGSTTGTLTIAKADQAITFAALENVYNSVTTVALNATSSSGLAVTYHVTSGPATVTGSTLTLNGTVGTVTIEATQAGNNNFNAATAVTRTLVVDQDPILSVDDPRQATVSAYPVPAAETLTINTGTLTIRQLTLVDAFGRLQVSVAPNASEYHVPVKNIADGIYILQVTTERGTVSRKVQIKK